MHFNDKYKLIIVFLSQSKIFIYCCYKLQKFINLYVLLNKFYFLILLKIRLCKARKSLTLRDSLKQF